MLSRREFTKSGMIAAAALGLTVAFPLTGCSSKTPTDFFTDKRHTEEADPEALSDEPRVQVKVLATDSWKLLLPALQNSYMVQHVNIAFDDPDFVEANQLYDTVKAGNYDAVFGDLRDQMTLALIDGIISDNHRLSIYRSYVDVIASDDLDLSMEGLVDLESDDIKTIVIGDTTTVYAGEYANQALEHEDLYTESSGVGGEYAASIASKVKIVATAEELFQAVNEGAGTVALVASVEAKVHGMEPVYRVPLYQYRQAQYQVAPVETSANAMMMEEFIRWCVNDSEPQRIAETYEMNAQG